jgi:heat shock protein HslJ
MFKKSTPFAALAVVLLLSGCFEDKKKAEEPAPAAAEIVQTDDGEVSDAVVMDGGEEMSLDVAVETTSGPDISVLTSGEWNAQAIRGKALIAGTRATMLVDPQGTAVSGNGTCNNFSGRASVKEDGRVVFSSVMSTKRACADMAQNAQESAFMAALAGVTTWGYDEENRLLSLMNGRGEEVLVFAKEADAEKASEVPDAPDADIPDESETTSDE